MARPTFTPSAEQRRLAKMMAGMGTQHEKIALLIGCTAKTLRKHFRDELDRGAIEANCQVAQSLYQNATKKMNVTAQIFWLKTRDGWGQPRSGETTTRPPDFIVAQEIGVQL